jgi:hypothetical protein
MQVQYLRVTLRSINPASGYVQDIGSIQLALRYT